MWIPMPQGEFKSSDERTVTARAPKRSSSISRSLRRKKNPGS